MLFQLERNEIIHMHHQFPETKLQRLAFETILVRRIGRITNYCHLREYSAPANEYRDETGAGSGAGAGAGAGVGAGATPN